MTKVYKLTQQGFEDLKAELNRLKDVDREHNKIALQEARAQGDLSENADYDAAREEQARIEGRIKEIETIMKHYEIIREDENTNIVNIGNTVTIEFVDLKKTNSYRLVGHLEADPLNGRISNESPIGRGIIGKKVNDVLLIKTEKGNEVKIRIKDIK